MKRLPKLAYIFGQCEIVALVRDDAPMPWTLNHMPDEIDAMYETVAKDKDVVLVHVLVLSLEEPRASGGGKQCFYFLFVHKNKF